MRLFHRGDICKLSLDPTLGHEQQGYRPVLILTPEPYNTLTGTAVVAPITNGGNFARENGFSVSLENTGIKTTGIVRCDQIRSIDLMARQAKVIERAPKRIISESLEIVSTLFEEDDS